MKNLSQPKPQFGVSTKIRAKGQDRNVRELAPLMPCPLIIPILFERVLSILRS